MLRHAGAVTVDNVKSIWGGRAKGRSARESGEGYQLREVPARYSAHFGAENVDIGPENLHFWDVILQ
ncbi:MAG: hypothetical protein JRJ14_07610 [Deltaproteobacteria bacterium]|nr:hypothetical protein [Deltaproteobacteria bacterium]